MSHGASVPRVIPEEIRPALMTKLLIEMKSAGELSSLANIAEFHGTGASVLELIDELQRAGLAPAEVIAALEESSCQESHLLELSRVYQKYWQFLKQLNYYDQKSLALKARELLVENPVKQFELVIIDGFDRVSHLQAQVFAGLARRTSRTKIAFDHALKDWSSFYSGNAPSPLKQNVEDYLWKQGSYAELLNNLQPTLLRLVDGKRTTELVSLAPVLGTSAIAQAPDVKLEAISLLDPFLEMVEVSRQIKEALGRRNVSPSDLIVVTRSAEAYNGAIEVAFEDAGINYFIDGSSKVNELEAWRFVRDLFKLAENEFKRKDLIDLIRSPFMNLPALSMTAREVSLLDRQSYDSKLIGGESYWKEFLSKSKGLRIIRCAANFAFFKSAKGRSFSARPNPCCIYRRFDR